MGQGRKRRTKKRLDIPVLLKADQRAVIEGTSRLRFRVKGPAGKLRVRIEQIDVDKRGKSSKN